MQYWSRLLIFMGERMDNVGLAAVMLLAAFVVIGLPLLAVWALFG
jgi:hypothetical protein